MQIILDKIPKCQPTQEPVTELATEATSEPAT